MSYPSCAQERRNHNDNAAVLGIVGIGMLGILTLVLNHFAGPVGGSAFILIVPMAGFIIAGPTILALVLHEKGRNPLLPVGTCVTAMIATAVASSILLGNPAVGGPAAAGFSFCVMAVIFAIEDGVGTVSRRRFDPDTLPALVTMGLTLTLVVLGTSAILSPQIMLFSIASTVLVGVAAAINLCQEETNRDLSSNFAACAVAGVVVSLAITAIWVLLIIWFNSLEVVNFRGSWGDGFGDMPIWRWQ